MLTQEELDKMATIAKAEAFYRIKAFNNVFYGEQEEEEYAEVQGREGIPGGVLPEDGQAPQGIPNAAAPGEEVPESIPEEGV
jgi:hypothetical protein